ncbi:MAG: ABC transporter substrate-binding protein [Janthinobacterium lividum]
MVRTTRRAFVAAVAASAIAPAARAQTNPARIRIGLLTDLSGPYRDTGGVSSIACARQAITEMKGGMDVELLVADHQQKTDVGLGIARQWLDRDGVDVIIDVNNSAIALAVAGLVRDKDRMHLNTGAATSDLTGKSCNPNTAAWTTDTWCRAHGTAGAVLKGGGKTWFFITADYAFGHAIQEDAAKVITASGGSIVGSAQYPFPATSDFSAMLVQAGSSGADVIAFANTGSDLANCIKQAREFGLPHAGQRLVAMSGYITDVHAIGVEDGQGLVLTENFYWDLNPRTRAFAARVKDATMANWPSTAHAAAYAATLHYLKVAADMGPAQAKVSGAATMAAMKRRPTDDDCFGPGVLRADGRKIHPAYLFQVKSPKTSTGPWDLYTVAETIPAEQAFRPLSEGACPMVPA